MSRSRAWWLTLRLVVVATVLGAMAACGGPGDPSDGGPEAQGSSESSEDSTESIGETTAQPTTTTTSASTTTSTTTLPEPLVECGLDEGMNTRRHADHDRTVWFHPPEVSQPVPALVLFHGFAGIADEFAANTGLTDDAPAAGVALVVPVGLGTPPTWEIGNGSFDDAGFLRTLVDELAADPCIDSERIWFAGYSAGAGFAGILACPLGPQLAGVVMNAAIAPALCLEAEGFDMIVSHGTADRVVPYDGLDIGGTTQPGTADLTAGWAERLGCGDPFWEVLRPADDSPGAPLVLDDGTRSERPDYLSSDEGTVLRERWTGCGPEANTVDLISYVGGGHRWPGQDRVGGEGLIPPLPDLSCTVLAAIDGASDPVAICL